MIREYTHELNREIRSIAGAYELDSEGRLQIKGEEVLYTVGNALIDSSCCGSWGCRFAIVPGYIRNLNIRKNRQGYWVSEVEPVVDLEAQSKIKQFLEKQENVSQVEFL